MRFVAEDDIFLKLNNNLLILKRQFEIFFDRVTCGWDITTK